MKRSGKKLGKRETEKQRVGRWDRQRSNHGTLSVIKLDRRQLSRGIMQLVDGNRCVLIANLKPGTLDVEATRGRSFVIICF